MNTSNLCLENIHIHMSILNYPTTDDRQAIFIISNMRRLSTVYVLGSNAIVYSATVVCLPQISSNAVQVMHGDVLLLNLISRISKL